MGDGDSYMNHENSRWTVYRPQGMMEVLTMNSRQLEAAWFGKTAKSKAQDFADKVIRYVQELDRPDDRNETTSADGSDDQIEMYWSVSSRNDCYIEIATNRRGQIGGYVRGDFYRDPRKAAQALDEWSEELYEG